MPKNEATLEARLDALLRTVFPTFRQVNVVHQKSFSIKFGHHNVSIDLKDPSKRAAKAISDILLTIGDIPIILVELKRESLSLTDEDVNQGISYARLIQPMPPLTLISNGRDNRFYETYTKERLDRATIDKEFLQDLTDSSFILAQNDFKDAITLLLNRDPMVFSQVINGLTEERFRQQIGKIDDFKKAICDEFIIERKNVSEIENSFSHGSTLVGLIGAAFSGKTNLLHQFFIRVKSNSGFGLYIDCQDHNYRIFQQLANRFTEYAKFYVSPDKVREWLLNSLHGLTDNKFYLLIDNFNNEIPDTIKGEIFELIDIFRDGTGHVLYTIDEFNYKKIAYVENRKYNTLIGEQSKISTLGELDDQELILASNILLEKYGLAIQLGGQYTPEYRQPRILRHLVSLYKIDVISGFMRSIDAVPNLSLLSAISENRSYTGSVHGLYRKIVKCFFTEGGIRQSDAELNIMSYGSGAITLETFKEHYPDDLPNLLKSSVAVLRKTSKEREVIYPKLPELVAQYSISVIRDLVMQQHAQNKTVKELATLLINCVTPIPFCDIVGVGVLLDIGRMGQEILLFDLIVHYLETPPRFEQLRAGTRALLYTEDRGHVEIEFQDDSEEEGFVDDYLPYVILSQLAAFLPSKEAEQENVDYGFHIDLLYQVGSFHGFLRRADPLSTKNVRALLTFNPEGVGHLVSSVEGIVEPIVQSIQKCFIRIPEEILAKCDDAFEENNINFLYRVYLALKNLEGLNDNKLAEKAQKFIETFLVYWDNFATNLSSIDKPEEGTA